MSRKKHQKTLRPTRPNAGFAVWYRRKLESEIEAMHASLVWWVGAQYRAEGIAMDAGSPVDRLQAEIERLRTYWLRHFDDVGNRMGRMFARKVLGYCDYNAKTAFKDMGMTVKMVMTPSMQQAYEGVIGEQVGLIRSIAEQHLGNVERVVMESVQRGRDLKYLQDQLLMRYQITKRRAALIASDQNNKATATLQATRQQDLGMTQGIWRHSHAGKKPRPEHVRADGETFDLAKGMYLEGEWVLPGQAIRCRCWWSPVLPKHLQPD